MANSVCEVLEYLLKHDDDAAMWKDDPFLCNRVWQMLREGQLEPNAAVETVRFIEQKITPCDTLASWHCRVHNSAISAISKGWPVLRQGYLHRWIAELATAEDSNV